MGLLHKRYFSRLRLLRYSDVEENSGPKALRMSCRSVYSWCLQWHTGLNTKKTKFIAGLEPLIPVMVISLLVVLSLTR